MLQQPNRITSIFTGIPTTKIYQGKPIRSSLFHRQEVPQMDAQFDALLGNLFASPEMHGGYERVAYCYPQAHYEHWQKQRPDLTFSPGIFGENFLLQETMPEDQVFIGDRFQIGSAIFVVSGPRLPCQKLGIQVGDVGFVQEFYQAGKTGFYLRLLQAGTVKQGDAMRPLTRGNHQLSVLQITQLILGTKLDGLQHVESSNYLATDLKGLILKKHYPQRA